MFNLTPRQIAILRALIDEYINTAIPVGSEPLERKYNLGVSPATIRNEMSVLVQQGFLKQPHSSSGRIPTAISYRLYISELMEESQLPVMEEVALKERIWDHRNSLNDLLEHTVKSLAESIKFLVVGYVQDGYIHTSGHAYLLDLPEFFDIDVTRKVLTLVDQEIDQLKTWVETSFASAGHQDQVHIVFGEELEEPFLEPVGMVYGRFMVEGSHPGRLVVVGPARMNFAQVLPRVRYFCQLIDELTV